MKLRVIILASIIFFIFNLITPTAILSDRPPPIPQWKGEGTKIKFESIPMITLQKILNRGSFAETQTITGTLNFPANAADKNVPVVILLSGSSGISDSQEYWIKILNNIGLATFTVDSNWARRKCRSDKENKSFYVGGPFCNGTHKGMLRIVDAYRALELLSKHPRIDPNVLDVWERHVEVEDASIKVLNGFKKCGQHQEYNLLQVYRCIRHVIRNGRKMT